ncbi:MAG: hypothetical protein AAF386_00440 [Pseudomonadota bacterium]
MKRIIISLTAGLLYATSCGAQSLVLPERLQSDFFADCTFESYRALGPDPVRKAYYDENSAFDPMICEYIDFQASGLLCFDILPANNILRLMHFDEITIDIFPNGRAFLRQEAGSHLYGVDAVNSVVLTEQVYLTGQCILSEDHKSEMFRPFP